MPTPSGEGAVSARPYVTEDRRVVVVPLRLKRGERYDFMLGGRFVRSIEGYPYTTAVEMHFSTREYKPEAPPARN
jgi:hypothetical protein